MYPAHQQAYLDKAISSILKIIFTVSAANSIALVLTKSGCKTFSSLISFFTPPLLILTPAFRCPCACLCLNSVTTLILFSPAFSANVVGTTSIASANAFQQIASVPVSSLAACASLTAISVSAAPPPARRAFFLTMERMAQWASWRERSVSSRMRELEPRQTMETVEAVVFTPDTLT